MPKVADNYWLYNSTIRLVVSTRTVQLDMDLHETAVTDLYSLLVDSNLISNPKAPTFLIVVTANVNGKILRAF